MLHNTTASLKGKKDYCAIDFRVPPPLFLIRLVIQSVAYSSYSSCTVLIFHEIFVYDQCCQCHSRTYLGLLTI